MLVIQVSAGLGRWEWTMAKTHPKKCFCGTCAPVKLAAFKQQYLEKVRLMSIPRPPASKDAIAGRERVLAAAQLLLQAGE